MTDALEAADIARVRWRIDAQPGKASRASRPACFDRMSRQILHFLPMLVPGCNPVRPCFEWSETMGYNHGVRTSSKSVTLHASG
jgi:hypothetical protein